MKNIRINTCVSMLSALFGVGCSNSYYSPALYKNDISYQFKPMSTDSQKTANYVTGAVIMHTRNNNGIGSDNIVLGQLAYNRASTYQYINLSYGAYGFAGTYNNGALQNTDAGYFVRKSLYGAGARVSANYFVKEGNSDQRIIGIDASYSHEFGDFSAYRKSVQNTQYIYSDASNSVLTAGITNETIWHSRNDNALQYGYRVFFGAVFGNHQFINGTQPNDQSPYITYKEECLAVSGFIQVKQVQGIIEMSNLSTIRFGLGFRF